MVSCFSRNGYLAGLAALLATATATAAAAPAPTARAAHPTGHLAVRAVPTISGAAPGSGVAGTPVTLSGTNLANATALTVNGVPTTITANTATSLSFTVPAGAGPSQSIAVTTAGGTATSTAFTVRLALVGSSPVANARSAPRPTSALALTFSEPVTAASIAPSATAGLRVFSSQVGGRKAGTVALSGNTARYASSLGGTRSSFMPGEVISVTVPGTVRGSGGLEVGKKVVQFTAATAAASGTVAAKTDFTTGTNPRGIALGDVNSDGQLDVVTANFGAGANSVSVLLGTGAGSFGAGTDFATGDRPAAVVLGDVNSDGRLDVVTTNTTGTSASVLLGTGTGSFGAKTDVGTGNNPFGLALGDVNGDGALDIVTANNAGSSASVLLGTGTGSFGARTDFATNGQTYAVALGDVNGDGQLDVVTTNLSANTCSVLLGTGTGAFGAATDYPTGTTPFGLALGDVNGDGQLDVVTANFNSADASVLLGTGAGTFGAKTDVATGPSPFSVALGDVDGDGQLDIVTSNYNGASASVLLGTGAGLFAVGTDYPTGSKPIGLALGDVNGDGRLDLATANNETGTNTASVLLGEAAPVPVITTLTPNTGPIGTLVAIAGTNLAGATSVRFNGTAQTTITNNTATSLTVAVPAGATTGPVTVTTPGGTSNGLPFTVTQPAAVAWTGATSTDWNTPTNWNPAVVPTASIDATIAPAANQPLLTGTGQCNNLTLAAATRLGLAAAATLTASGSAVLAGGSALAQAAGSELYLGRNLTNNGATFALAPGSEIGFGIAATEHLVNGTAGLTFQTLTVGERGTAGTADNLRLAVPVAVQERLALSHQANVYNNAGGSLTLLSNTTGTALLVQDASSAVLGTATVQRYLTTANPGRGYRHYSSPVSGNTLADLATGTFVPVFNPAYNTAAAPLATTPFPTVLGYDQSRLATATNNLDPFSKGWYSPSTLAGGSIVPGAFVAGQGYTAHLPGTETVDFVGTPRTGPVPLTLTRSSAAGAGLHLVGNPYPAPLDWSAIAPADRPNIDGAIYVFESSSPYGGSYRSYANGVGGGNPLIGMAQGFFVRVTPGQASGTLTFRNAHRLSSTTQVPVRRTAADVRPQAQLTLAGAGTSDDLFVYAEAGATPGADAEFDAVKLPNPTGLNVAALAATGEALAIQGLPPFAGAAVAVPLALALPAPGRYVLRAAALRHFAPGQVAYLTDAATGTRQNLATNATYPFAVASAGNVTGRFALVFGPAANALAVAAAPATAAPVLTPNPARSTVLFALPAAPAAREIQVLDALGRVVRRATLAAQAPTVPLDVAGLATGVYVVRCGTASARLMVE